MHGDNNAGLYIITYGLCHLRIYRKEAADRYQKQVALPYFLKLLL